MKLCGRCGESKPPEAFHRRGAILQAWCRACRKEYDSRYHGDNAPKRRAQAKLRRIRLTSFNAEMKAAYPCADCDRYYHHAAMTCDHLPGEEKVDDVAALVNGAMRRKYFIELTKCELVCANCHAVRTWRRQRGVAQPG